MRERVERLFDPDTFHETGALAGWGTYEDGELAEFLPANVVVGQGRIDGRRAVVQGDDFTVRGGAADAAIWQKMVYAERMASELRLPLVRLVDGTGGGGSVKSLETMGFTYVPVHPGLGGRRGQPLGGAGGGRRARPGGRARRGPRGGLALLRDRARHRAAVRGRVGMVAVLRVVPTGTASAQPPGDRPGWRWFKGNTHTHTLNSDGDSTPDDVVRWYRENRYHFLVLTDHNFLTDVEALQALTRRGTLPGDPGRRSQRHRTAKCHSTSTA